MTEECLCVLTDGTTAALWLSAKVLELEAEATKLREELQDTRDHADLLEFRCLELTEGADKVSTDLAILVGNMWASLCPW